MYFRCLWKGQLLVDNLELLLSFDIHAAYSGEQSLERVMQGESWWMCIKCLMLFGYHYIQIHLFKIYRLRAVNRSQQGIPGSSQLDACPHSYFYNADRGILLRGKLEHPRKTPFLYPPVCLSVLISALLT